MTEFLNSYHFVPVDEAQTATGNRVRRRPSDLGYGSRVGEGHAIYAAQRSSGRILCRLETVSPLVLGGENRQVENGNHLITPFELGGRPAIPATSLKGMISSIVEAVSGSAMRVLAEQTVSFRRPAAGGLHAIGRLRRDGTQWLLEPLTAPLIEIDGGKAQLRDRALLWRRAFENFAAVKTYIGGPTEIATATEALNAFEKHGDRDKQTLNVALHFDSLDRLLKYADAHIAEFHVKKGNQKSLHLLAAKSWSQASLPPVDDGAEVETNAAGFFRTLGLQGRDIPKTKKHELFIPYPESRREAIRAQALVVPTETILRFRRLAEDCASKNEQNKATGNPGQRLPYTPYPVGKAGPADDDWEQRIVDGEQLFVPKLREGQLVYFDIEQNGADPDGPPIVSEISFSAIWRDGPMVDERLANTRDYFGEEMRPMNPKRETISTAEALFGFVSVGDDKKDDGVRALAGRLRFSNAVPAADFPSEPYLSEVELRELSSPKPPSPSLYFKRADGAPVAKTRDDLAPKTRDAPGPTTAAPQGRKFYLGARPDDGAREPWRTRVSDHDSAKRRARVQPLTPALQFEFHVDYDNLTRAELALLLFALLPQPDQPDTFTHKLGHGKPLGLGSVRITPLAVLEVDRKSRYSAAGYGAPRYHRYCGEIPEAMQAFCDSQDVGLDPRTLARSGRETAAEKFPNAVAALLAIGGPIPEDAYGNPLPVLPSPMTNAQYLAWRDEVWRKGDDRSEKELYAWFVANEKSKGRDKQRLRPLGPNGLRGATLKTNGP